MGWDEQMSGDNKHKLERLLHAIDVMARQGPDHSQADYDAWENVWAARQAFDAGA